MYSRRRLFAAAAVAIVAFAGAVTAIQATAATSAAVNASCGAPAYDGSTLTLTCTVPQATTTVTEMATVTATVTASPSASVIPSSTSVVSPSATPTPDPSPSQSGNGAFPDASSTGPSGALKPVAGDYTVAAGVIASGLDIAGGVTLGKGAQLLNSRVRCTNVTDWCVQLTGQNVVQDTEIGGGANGSTFGKGNAFWSGPSSAGNTFRRVDIHHTSDGGRVDGGTTLVDSWIHAIPSGDPGVESNHGDGIQVTSGGQIVVDHCSIEGGNNDAFFVQFSGSEPIGDITLQNSLFTGVSRNGQESSYGISIENKNIRTGAKLTVTGNRFAGTFQVGPLSVPKSAVATGNTYLDGTAVPVYRS